MTNFPVILAHGALGAWDEIIFFGVAAVFVVMMVISWISSQQVDEDDEQAVSLEPTATPIAQNAPRQEERFELR